MKVAVLGASGRTGLALVRALLSQNISTIAVVRNPSRLPEDIQAKVTVVTGEGTSDKTAQAALEHNPDIIVCTVGSASPFGVQSICTDVTRTFVNAIKNVPNTRFIAMSSVGAHDSASQVGILTRIVVATVLKQVMKDHTAQEDAVTCNLPKNRWLILRPTVLNDKPADKNYQTMEKGRLNNDHISRNTVAQFITDQIIGHSDSFWGKKVAITSK